MDHNHLQKAIETYNASMAAAVKQYEKALVEHQERLLSQIREQMNEAPKGSGEDGNVTLSSEQVSELLSKVSMVDEFIKNHPEIQG